MPKQNIFVLAERKRRDVVYSKNHKRAGTGGS